MTITNNASFDAGANPILIGDDAGNATNFGSLTFNSTAAVTIGEDSATVLSGMSTANSLLLRSAGSITDGTDADLAVTNVATFDAGANPITLGNDAGNVFLVSSLTLKSGGAVFIQGADDTVLTGINSAASLTLISAGSITDVAEVGQAGTFTTVTGNASFTTINPNTFIRLGDTAADVVRFGSVTFNSPGDVSITEDDATQMTGSNTANNLVITSSGAITDAVNTDLMVNGNASFVGMSVTLGETPADMQTYGRLSFVVAGNPQLVSLAEGNAEFEIVNAAQTQITSPSPAMRR